jgi:hypothetical protein
MKNIEASNGIKLIKKKLKNLISNGVLAYSNIILVYAT